MSYNGSELIWSNSPIRLKLGLFEQRVHANEAAKINGIEYTVGPAPQTRN